MRTREASDDLARREIARLPREVTSAIQFYMEEHAISQRQLADRLHITPGRVSQILSGDENLTLRTLATVSAALRARFEIDLVGDIPADQQRARQPHPHSPVPVG